MDCNYISSRLTQFLFDELDEAESKEIEDHIQNCIQCSEKITREREAVSQSGNLSSKQELRPEFRENLLQAVHTEIAHIQNPKTVFSRTWKAAVFAALVLVTAAVIITVVSVLHKDQAQHTDKTGQPRYTWEHSGISSLEKSSFDAPVLSKNTIYALKKTGTHSSLVALDAATGSITWNSDEPVTGYVTADSLHVLGVLRVSGTTAVLKCFNAATGKLKWKYNPKGPSSACSVPEIYNNSVCWSTGNALHHINRSTGEQKWSRTFPEKGLLSNSVTTQKSLMIVAGNVLHKLDSANGDTLRSYTLKEASASRMHRPLLAVSSSSVCAVLFKTPAWKADLVCFDSAAQKISWFKEVSSVSHIHITGSTAIVRAGNVYAYNTETDGALQWEYKSSGCSPVSLIDNHVYFFNTQGTGSLVVLESETGSVKSTYTLPPSCAGITVTGHQGIINAHNGVLYSFML